MISEVQTGTNVLSDGDEAESMKMELDLDSAQILMQMLSKNLYSDPIGSTVRECASNALDSHRKAGVDKPIVVYLGHDSSYNYEFTVEDFGVGLDADDVKNIIRKYGKSTKRDSAIELGMMGLGFKAPLSYTSSFYFICRKNSIEYKYMMYEGETDNIIDTLYQQPTDKENGVKIIIPVKSGDRNEFLQKIKTQLAYFENIYFDVDGIDNNFSILRGDIYQHSELNTFTALHLCLDNVCYPIDFEKLGIKRVELPVALRFSLSDGIFPTPNREAVRYSVESKKIILDRIVRLADHFVNEYNATIVETNDIREVFKYYDNSSRYITFNNLKYDITALVSVSTLAIVKPKLVGVSLLDLKALSNSKDYILEEYSTKYTYSRGRITEIKNYSSDVHVREMNNTHFYLFTGSLMGNKKEYIKTLLSGGQSYKFVKKMYSYRLGNQAKDRYDTYTYCTILGLKNKPKDQWRQIIKEFQYVQSLYLAEFVDYDSIVIPQKWLDDRKKQRISTSDGGNRKLKLKGDVIGKEAEQLERAVQGKNCKFVSTLYKLENIHKNPGLIVYAPHDDSEIMDELWHISRRTTMKLVTFSDREIKALEKIDIHNLMSFKTFMEGKNKPFQRLITAYLIDKLIQENKSIFYKKGHLETVSKDLYNKLVELQKYKDDNYVHSSETIYSAMLEVAVSKNLFDTTIYSTYLDIKQLFVKLKFLNPLMGVIGSFYTSTVDPMANVLCDLFKYYKHRIDYANYNITINDMSWIDEALPDDEVVLDDDAELTDDTVNILQDQLNDDPFV